MGLTLVTALCMVVLVNATSRKFGVNDKVNVVHVTDPRAIPPKFRVGDRVTVAHHLIDPRLDDMDGEVGKVASIYLSYAASSKLPSKHYRLESQNSELNARFSKVKFEEKHLEKLPSMKRPTDAEMPSKGKA